MNQVEDGHKLLADGGERVEQLLAESIDWSRLPDHLAEAAQYGVLGGGKRLRPILVLTCCSAVSGREVDAAAAATALELVHCFSLVHDDLPALDDDELRRGRPTLHVHSGEPMAILAGDLMLAMAFGVIATGPCPPNVRVSLVEELATGTSDMVAGQVYDTIGGLPVDISPLDQVRLVHRNKTGALIRTACRMGGLCGGASPEAMAALTQYGEAMGLMFQIVDDLLDITQSADHVGKATGKDAALGKRTYPAVLAESACQAEVDRLRDKATTAAKKLGDGGYPLQCLAEVMAVRTR
ncbi:MAG: polyprenyl synthetase family protein [Planctomycetes bacterium]|nr:polyprenyl synthetase family protein [Planctomycetota bacterium]MCP4838771.1 polyprenyl synthetase family protein [Planctomycetota bacterium]